jgi:predicted CXXCH cytochrome family protein
LKNHVWRPLFVVVAIVIVILVVRFFYVPSDFGAQERGYTFGYHRLSNEQEWKDFPAKYKDNGSAYCNNCHTDKVEAVANSQHAMIPCENCHGPARNHPTDPEKLLVDLSRDLCIRCHAKLYMPSSGRNNLPGIDPATHNVGIECSVCHNPHNPSLQEM